MIDLWIRSQDRRALLKINGLHIYQIVDENFRKKAQDEHDNIMSKAYNFGSTEKAEAKARETKNEYLKRGKVHTYIKDNTTNLIIGEYEPEERALEVLDEIDRFKNNIYHEKRYNTTYEMPKE